MLRVVDAGDAYLHEVLATTPGSVTTRLSVNLVMAQTPTAGSPWWFLIFSFAFIPGTFRASTIDEMLNTVRAVLFFAY